MKPMYALEEDGKRIAVQPMSVRHVVNANARFKRLGERLRWRALLVYTKPAGRERTARNRLATKQKQAARSCPYGAFEWTNPVTVV